MFEGSYFIRMANQCESWVAEDAMRVFGENYGYAQADSEEQATVIVTDSEAEATRALQGGKSVLFMPLSDDAQLPPAISSGFEGHVALVLGIRPTIADTYMAVSQLR